MTPAKRDVSRVVPTRRTLDSQSPDLRLALVTSDPDPSQNGVWARDSERSPWERAGDRTLDCSCVVMADRLCAACAPHQHDPPGTYGYVDPRAGQYVSRLSRMVAHWAEDHLFVSRMLLHLREVGRAGAFQQEYAFLPREGVQDELSPPGEG